MVNKKIKMMPVIKALEKDKPVDFPIEKMLSVKSICTSISTVTGMVFTTSVNRKEKIITVTRLK